MTDRIRIVVGDIEDRPEIDIYRSDTGHQTQSVVVLDPDARRIMIEQRSVAPGQGIPIDEYHGLVLTGRISRDEYGEVAHLYPLADETRAYLRGDAGQALLRRICDGWDSAWDGNNVTGRLTEDAKNAWNQLEHDLADYAEEASYVAAGDWIADAEATSVTVDTTDEELATLAADIEREAWEDHRVVLDDVDEELANYRDLLRTERDRQNELDLITLDD